MFDIKIGIEKFLIQLLAIIRKSWNGKDLKFRNNACWKKNKEVPFCQVCFDNEGKLNPLQSIAGFDWDYECKNCKEHFYVSKKGPKVEVNRR
ncbi:MAG: hypothetical protein U9N04_02590 [Patescibacteria group bacterium]|nr:hypothetical protein [Patescibacteria group bacterium]